MDVDLDNKLPKLPREIEEKIFNIFPENFNSLVFLDNYTSNWVRSSVDFQLQKVFNLYDFDKLEEVYNITKEQVKDNFYRYIKDGNVDNFEMEFISWLIFTNRVSSDVLFNTLNYFLSEMKSGLENVSKDNYHEGYFDTLKNILYHLYYKDILTYDQMLFQESILEQRDINLNQITLENLIWNTKDNHLWYLIKYEFEDIETGFITEDIELILEFIQTDIINVMTVKMYELEDIKEEIREMIILFNENKTDLFDYGQFTEIVYGNDVPQDENNVIIRIMNIGGFWEITSE